MLKPRNGFIELDCVILKGSFKLSIDIDSQLNNCQSTKLTSLLSIHAVQYAL